MKKLATLTAAATLVAAFGFATNAMAANQLVNDDPGGNKTLGVCDTGFCTTGQTGDMCTVNIDCGFLEPPPCRVKPDETTIQAGIDAASPFNTVTVCPGRYFENVVVDVTGLELLAIKGPKGDVLSQPIVDAGGSGSAITITVNDVTLRGFKLKNSGDNTNPPVVARDAGLRVETDNNFLRISAANENGADGILILGDGNTVEGANVHDNVRDGIHVLGTGNILTQVKAHMNTGDGIHVVGDVDNVVEKSTATANLLDGIHVAGDENLIEGNVVQHNGGDGIHVAGDDNDIEENTSLANDNHGIHVTGDGNSIDENSVAANVLDGIHVEPATGDPNTVTDNKANNNVDDGFQFIAAATTVVERNTATRNGVCGFDGAAVYGIGGDVNKAKRNGTDFCMDAGPVGEGSIKGTVIDEDTLAKLRGVVVTTDTAPPLSATTKGNGTYTINDVPAGIVTVTATEPFPFECKFIDDDVSSSTVIVTGSKSVTANLELDCPPPPLGNP